MNGSLPLFVMDVVLPRQNYTLNIFEPRCVPCARLSAVSGEAGIPSAREPQLPPAAYSTRAPSPPVCVRRYRLMIRRCMEGSRRFGMLGVNPPVEGAALTEVEITQCEALADGRFHIEVVGRRRCFVVSLQDQDGYRLARVRFDPPPAADQPQQGADLELLRIATEVNELASVWVVRVRAHIRPPHPAPCALGGDRPSRGGAGVSSYARCARLPAGEAGAELGRADAPLHRVPPARGPAAARDGPGGAILVDREPAPGADDGQVRAAGGGDAAGAPGAGADDAHDSPGTVLHHVRGGGSGRHDDQQQERERERTTRLVSSGTRYVAEE